jgi:hypothetical protein
MGFPIKFYVLYNFSNWQYQKKLCGAAFKKTIEERKIISSIKHFSEKIF